MKGGTHEERTPPACSTFGWSSPPALTGDLARWLGDEPEVADVVVHTWGGSPAAR